MGRERQHNTEARGVRSRDGLLYIDFQFKGKRCRECLGIDVTKANIKYASRLRSAILHEISVGTFSYRAHFPDSKNAVIFAVSGKCDIFTGDALKDYLKVRKRTLAKSAYDGYESAIRIHLVPTFGNIKLRSLSTSLIRTWIADDLSHLMNKTINNILTPLRGMLDDAFSDGLIDSNPMNRIHNMKPKTREPEPFSPEESQRIIDKLSGQDRNIIQFGFWSGLRISELIALEWSDVDLVNEVASIRRASVRGDEKGTKTEAGSRELKILPPAMEALQSQRQYSQLAGGRVFLNPRENAPWINDVQLRSRVWKCALKLSGVRYRNMYQMRHSYASFLLSAGENPAWVANQMGHTNMSMTLKVYARWIPSVDPNAGKVAAAMAEKLSTKVVDKSHK